MRDLITLIPNVDILVAMEPEELAAKLLTVLKRRLQEQRFVHLDNALGEFEMGNNNRDLYPQERVGALKLAVAEAWHWLEAQGLLIPSLDSNGRNGFRILSRRAAKIADETGFAQFQASRHLPKEILHERFADRVWSAFLRGEFDVAVFQAMKGVEVYVREASGMGTDKIGIVLMQEAFKEEGGVLADMTAEKGERRSRMQLFCGAIGSYKNAGSHREVNLEDPVEATELILLANHLMRIVDGRVTAMANKS